MSPEYATRGLFSVKSDVFSFGVLLLEIVSGRKNTAFQHSESSAYPLAYVSNCCKLDLFFNVESDAGNFAYRFGSCGKQAGDWSS